MQQLELDYGIRYLPYDAAGPIKLGTGYRYDFSGCVFGNWKVLELAIARSSKLKTRWMCRCAGCDSVVSRLICPRSPQTNKCRVRENCYKGPLQVQKVQRCRRYHAVYVEIQAARMLQSVYKTPYGHGA